MEEPAETPAAKSLPFPDTRVPVSAARPLPARMRFRPYPAGGLQTAGEVDVEEVRMLHLAFDGSLHGSWVGAYGVRLASLREPRRLRVVHVRTAREGTAARLEALRAFGARWGVEVELVEREPGADGFATLVGALPEGADELVLCGLRVRSRRRAFLRGTVSERLLRLGRHAVVALRSVRPGLLGSPRRVLVPLSGHPRRLAAAWPFAHRLLPLAERVSILRVMPPGRLGLAHLSPGGRARLKDAGRRYVDDALAELRRVQGDAGPLLDGRVVIAADWAGQILAQASELNVDLILLGASERTLLVRALYNPLERILRDAPCDVGVCRGPVEESGR